MQPWLHTGLSKLCVVDLSDGRFESLATSRDREVTSRTTYFLSVHSYCCELDDGAIILELTTGTYVGVHAENLADLRASVQNWPTPRRTYGDTTLPASTTSDKLIADLLTRGILTTSPTAERRMTMKNAEKALTIAGQEAERTGVPIRHIPEFATALLQVSTHHKDKRLASLIDWLDRQQSMIRRHNDSGTSGSAMRLLASFFRLRIWFYTADRRCLFDSLVLAVFLTRRMIPCTFVIGVSTKPFLAHSWVQMDATVLNDTAENVQMFTPILVIGEAE